MIDAFIELKQASTTILLVMAPEMASLRTTVSALEIYDRLGILKENTQAALSNVPAAGENEGAQGAPRVILFTGHRVDAEGREKPRFPRNKEDQARAMIAETVLRERRKTDGELFGIAGGASGGDILFHEVCEDLGIPTTMYLVVPKNEYIKASVADGGPEWVERFKRLYDRQQPEILSNTGELPRWLRAKKGYNIWQRANLWMLHNALHLSKEKLTLIALWDEQTGDGPGGTEDMVNRAQYRGATFVHLDARKLIE